VKAIIARSAILLAILLALTAMGVRRRASAGPETGKTPVIPPPGSRAAIPKYSQNANSSPLRGKK